MDLIIVESPSKAKTITKYLKGKYRVDASAGHIRDLPVHSLGVDVKNNFEPSYVDSEGKEDVIRRLREETKKAGKVFLATDPDREGEAISWHLQTVLGLNPTDENRIEFNEVSQKAIEKALLSPRQINYNLVDAQQARRVLDRLVGYKLSSLLNNKIESDSGKQNLSGGRVQSVALRLIVEREREIQAFRPEEYWNLTAELSDVDNKYTPFKALLERKGAKKYKPTNEVEANEVKAYCEHNPFFVSKVKKAEVKTHAPAPFTTSSMQQDASNKLGFSSPETMSLAQHLYEGIQTENGDHIAFISYMRTDSVRISEDAQRAAREHIRSVFGDKYVPERPNYYATKQTAQDAHEAVRPIDVNMTPEKAKALLDKKHYALYKLIYERFIASQMSEAVYASTQMDISCGEYVFKASGKVMLFKGFTAIYQDSSSSKVEDKDDEEPNGKLLPDLAEGEEALLHKLLCEQKFTKPPLRYTDATLVKVMEEKGIGRPSTYATIISKLNQKYVRKEGKYMVPVEVSYKVVDMLCDCFEDVMDVGFTADMETKLDGIEDGGVDWHSVIADFYPHFQDNLRAASSYGDELSETVCEKCGKPMIRRLGKYGKYLACSGYPDCKNIVSEEAVQISATRCPRCGENMIYKSGKFGKFLACPNYPDCKTTLPIEDNLEPTLVGKCPECGSPMVAKKSKRGKVYYGCSGYPDCKFMSWDIPTGDKCPKCGSALVRFKDKVKCSNKDCGYREGEAENYYSEEASGRRNIRNMPAYRKKIRERATRIFHEDLDAQPLYGEALVGTVFDDPADHKDEDDN